MPDTRLEILKNMVAQRPDDVFSRYALAMEYRSSGDLEAAVREFRALIASNSDYSAAYFHCGQALEAMARPDEARAAYLQGIEATARNGDRHARSELQAALDLLG